MPKPIDKDAQLEAKVLATQLVVDQAGNTAALKADEKKIQALSLPVRTGAEQYIVKKLGEDLKEQKESIKLLKQDADAPGWVKKLLTLVGNKDIGKLPQKIATGNAAIATTSAELEKYEILLHKDEKMLAAKNSIVGGASVEKASSPSVPHSIAHKHTSK